MTKIRRTTLSEAYKIGEALKQRIEVHNRTCQGDYDYTGNWHDEDIAKEFGVSVWGVRSIREGIFGKHRGSEARSPATMARIEALEKTVKDYENSIANLEAEVASICKFMRKQGYTSPNGRMQPTVLKPFSHP